jgi:hypothetical protein
MRRTLILSRLTLTASPSWWIYLGVFAAMALPRRRRDGRTDSSRLGTARAVHFAPVSFLSYRYALLLALAGEREAALVQLERSLRVYPDAAGEVAAQLETLARSNRDVFAPLLELTVARSTPSTHAVIP